jgi:hypothetical protein
MHEPLKLKLIKNGPEKQASVEKAQQVNEILSTIKESHEKKEKPGGGNIHILCI